MGARIILIWYGGARVILVCGCSNHFGMRVLELFWYAGARVILVRGCSSHFGVRVLKLFCCKRAQVILVCACSFVCSNHFAVRVLKVVRNSFPFSIPAELYERLTRL